MNENNNMMAAPMPFDNQKAHDRSVTFRFLYISAFAIVAMIVGFGSKTLRITLLVLTLITLIILGFLMKSMS